MFIGIFVFRKKLPAFSSETANFINIPSPHPIITIELHPREGPE